MKDLKASATVSINGLAMQKRAQGERVFNFAAGDPVLDNHPRIIRKAIEQAEKKRSPYPPVEGIAELRILAAEWMNGSWNTAYQKENVMVTCGGKFALFALVYSLLQKDDEVLIPSPYWVSYPDIVKMAGGKPITIPSTRERGWKIRGSDLQKYVTEKSKLLIFNNASNPTGTLYTREELVEILATAKRLGLIVISDEVYSSLVYDGQHYISCGSLSEHRDRVVIVQSCSKNFAMAGWRVGFVMGAESIIKRLAMVQSQSTTGTSLISQWAAVGALEHAEEVSGYVRNQLEKRRNLFVQTYHSLFGHAIDKPQSALYAFVPLSSMKLGHFADSVAACEQLIAKCNVALVPGAAFGVEGYVRLAYSETEEEIVQGLRALDQGIREAVKK